jgi:hypothetical protein
LNRVVWLYWAFGVSHDHDHSSLPLVSLSSLPTAFAIAVLYPHTIKAIYYPLRTLFQVVSCYYGYFFKKILSFAFFSPPVLPVYPYIV